MKNKKVRGGGKNKNFIFLTLPVILLVAFFVGAETGFAEELPQLIISRVQISGDDKKSDNDFVELLNVGETPIDLKGYRLVKRTRTATKDTTLKSWTSSAVIPVKGYYLWANSKDGFAQSIGADVSTTGYLAADNGVAIRKGKENEGEIIDLLGWGGCNAEFFAKHIFASNPQEKEVISRETDELEKVGYVLECGIVPKHSGDLWVITDETQLCQKQKQPEVPVVSAPKIILGKLAMDEHVYENMFAYFEISKNADEKVTWTFGDGHKSYLAKTKHKYAAEGTYAASVKVYRGKENASQNFTVTVESFPRSEVKIVGINANPKGSDTKNETITLENRSKKKINLKDWSVATGWKKLVNHPIREDFFIKAGKKKELTRDKCAFTLTNTKDKLELRYPDGKVAYDVKYKKKEQAIAEGEEYVKTKKGWVWQNTKQETITKKQDTKNNQNTIIKNQIELNKSEIKKEEIMIERDVAAREEKTIVAKNKIELAVAKIDVRTKMSGARNVRESEGRFVFTPQVPEQKHYAVVFVEKMLLNANILVNSFLNDLF